VRRSFRAAVHLYSLAGVRLTAADCLLYIDIAPFTRTAWSGDLSNVRAAPLPPGHYLLRLPGGRAGRIELYADEAGVLTFTGEGPPPM